MLSSFQFGNALYLIGLASALIPLIIHLSRSKRTKKMRFSTTRFFTDQFLRSYRMSRIKEALLLVCRMALFALLAMALARPFVLPKGTNAAVASGGGPRTVALVLDNSASMAVEEEGRPLFAKAQAAATTLLNSLGPKDSVTVVLAGRRADGPEVLFPEPTDNFDEVRRAVAALRPTSLGTDLGGAIARAEEITLAGRSDDRGAAVYVISDLQESGWADVDEPSRKDRTDVSFLFVGVRPKQAPDNRAVTAVRYAATRPRVGVPFSLRPVFALSGSESKPQVARLYVDGAKVGEQPIESGSGQRWASARFHHTFTAPGWHGGHVEIDGDALFADNKRYFAVEVPSTTQTVPVLAVNGAPSAIPHQDELFFLRLALTAAPEGQNSPFRLEAIGPGEMADKLEGHPLVVLANVERLSEPALEKLEDYVDKGGSLLVFLGDKVDANFYNDALAGANRRHGGLLPARLDVPARPTAAGFISNVNYEHRALTAFAEPRFGALLAPSLTFKALSAKAAPQVVLMKSSSGALLLCEKAFGKGKVLLFTSTADRDWSDFPIRPAFPLWARFLAEYLTQEPLSLRSGHFTGDEVRLPAPSNEADAVPWVRKPDDKLVVAERGNGGAFVFRDTAEPGIYTVLKSDQETRAGMFAVNLESYESDLSYLEDGVAEGKAGPEREKAMVEELKVRLGGPLLVAYLDDPAKLSEALGGGGGAWRLWTVVLMIVLLIGLFEPWLANQISLRIYGKPREPVVVVPGAVVHAPAAKLEGAAR